MDAAEKWKSEPWTDTDLELYGLRSAVDGGLVFCGVSEEQFAINGVTYKWPRGSKLKWAVDFSRLGQLSDQDCKDCFVEALKEISECCDVSHEYTPNPRAANLLIVTKKLDGKAGVLADCQIPVGNVSVESTQLLMRLDDSESWVLAQNPAPGTIDLYRVFLHEAEHGHGLGHKPSSITRPALIAPTYSPTLRNLTDVDREELIRRYGPAKTVPTPQPPTPPLGDSLGVELVITQGSAKYRATGQAKRIQ